MHRDLQSEDKYDFEPASCLCDEGCKEQLVISKCAVDHYPRKELVLIEELGDYHHCVCGAAHDDEKELLWNCVCELAYSGQPADRETCRSSPFTWQVLPYVGDSPARMEAKVLLDAPSAYDQLREGNVYLIYSITGDLHQTGDKMYFCRNILCLYGV